MLLILSILLKLRICREFKDWKFWNYHFVSFIRISTPYSCIHQLLTHLYFQCSLLRNRVAMYREWRWFCSDEEIRIRRKSAPAFLRHTNIRNGQAGRLIQVYFEKGLCPSQKVNWEVTNERLKLTPSKMILILSSSITVRWEVEENISYHTDVAEVVECVCPTPHASTRTWNELQRTEHNNSDAGLLDSVNVWFCL